MGEKSAVEFVRERFQMTKSRENAVRRFRRRLDKTRRQSEGERRERNRPLDWSCDTCEECLEQNE
jgi:hypothetical protein